MSPRRSGWDFAQVRSSFLSDPEFQRLSRSCRNDRDFYAAIGLWTVALAQAWREDCEDVTEVLSNYPRGAENLATAQLVKDGLLVGFAKWTETVRRVRTQDAARKSGNQAPPPLDTTGMDGTPPDSHGLPRTPVEFPRGVGAGVVVKENVLPPNPRKRGLGSRATGTARRLESRRYGNVRPRS